MDQGTSLRRLENPLSGFLKISIRILRRSLFKYLAISLRILGECLSEFWVMSPEDSGKTSLRILEIKIPQNYGEILCKILGNPFSRKIFLRILRKYLSRYCKTPVRSQGNSFSELWENPFQETWKPLSELKEKEIVLLWILKEIFSKSQNFEGIPLRALWKSLSGFWKNVSYDSERIRLRTLNWFCQESDQFNRHI